MAPIPMTDEECRLATEALSDQIDLYAELLVKKGVALQPDQELVVQAPVEAADFARRVVRSAYRAGAGHVTVIWHDDAVSRLTYENCPVSYFEVTPSWQVEQLNSLAEAGAAFLFLEGSDPSWFGFVITCGDGVSAAEVTRSVEEAGVQTRRLFAGNLVRHPCFDPIRGTDAYRVIGDLHETDRVMNDTFWLGVYPGMNDDMIAYMADSVRKAVS